MLVEDVDEGFPRNSNSPLEPDNKDDLGLSTNVKVTRLSGLSLQSDLLSLLSSVLSDVLVGPLEDDLSLLLLLLQER